MGDAVRDDKCNPAFRCTGPGHYVFHDKLVPFRIVHQGRDHILVFVRIEEIGAIGVADNELGPHDLVKGLELMGIDLVYPVAQVEVDDPGELVPSVGRGRKPQHEGAVEYAHRFGKGA